MGNRIEVNEFLERPSAYKYLVIRCNSSSQDYLILQKGHDTGEEYGVAIVTAWEGPIDASAMMNSTDYVVYINEGESLNCLINAMGGSR